MRTLEEAVLVAALNEDDDEAVRLASTMLTGELYAFSRTLERLKRTVDQQLWEKKTRKAREADESADL